MEHGLTPDQHFYRSYSMGCQQSFWVEVGFFAVGLLKGNRIAACSITFCIPFFAARIANPICSKSEHE